ncbi:MAG: crosslink repair DNA glycosylase YcaQ family protein, partial [Actinomycetia bacterium]|nr:crosslink repair DNA glycosylase YcaQ family protein [Actinomycetes bacterium]
MVDAALGRARLVAQGLVTQRFARPVDAVSAFGAHQGQDLPGVLASVALRTRDTSVEAVVDAFARGEIVRGYPMRGTVFALPGGDARWITELCVAPGLREAERLLRVNRLYTDDDLDRAVGCLHDVLAYGPRPRAELHAAWDRAGLMAPQGAGYHLLRHQVMRGTAVLGPIVDGDQQVALASTWLPPGSGLEDRFNGDRDAATAEFLRRYLTSHGPATLRDFAWWTKLPLGQVRRAAALIR